MHIVLTTIRNTEYCYVAECIWNHEAHKYDKPSKLVGKLNEEKQLIPNAYLSDLLVREASDSKSLTPNEQLTLKIIKERFGTSLTPKTASNKSSINGDIDIQTATIIHFGPQLVFGTITKRLKIDSILNKAFGDKLGKDILSLSWYITSEGSALSNNDCWLDYFENPRGYGLSSQEVSKLLDAISYDGMMTFYKLWLKGFTKSDKVLYDLTSISYYGTEIHSADWGYNRDHESLPQVNYALLCVRHTAIPLFAWPLVGSVSDVSTLENTLEFLHKLGYKPNCMMMDRGFASKDNIGYMLQRRYTFLQALKVNAKWVYEIIDASESIRLSPTSMLQIENRTYYTSTTHLLWIRSKKRKNEKVEEETFFLQCDGKRDHYKPSDETEEVLDEHYCQAHILFCQDLVGNTWDRFMWNLKNEYTRLLDDESTKAKPTYAPYFLIEKPKYARRRSIEFNTEAINNHKNKYTGFICFLTNDPSIKTAKDALAEYSTRDYIEKDFDEMKNDLDMYRLRVHSDSRMKARLFIQFIAEIFLREIRFKLKQSEDCKKMTKTQIFSHIKAISKIHFENKYNDIIPTMSKNQRNILSALDVEM